MSTVHQLTSKAIGVAGLPEDASDLNLHYSTHFTNDDVFKLFFSSDFHDPLKCGGDMMPLPPGPWEILCAECIEARWPGR